MKNFRSKQFISFKLQATWSHPAPSSTDIPLSGVFVLFVLPSISHLVAILVIRSVVWYHSVCVQVTLILLNNGPKALHNFYYSILL